jgi:actin-related protein
MGGEDIPRTLFPTVIGQPKQPTGDIVVGEKALHNRDAFSLIHPIKGGKITNWDQWQTIVRHAFAQVPCSPETHPILFIEKASLNTKRTREKLTELAFEVYLLLSFFFFLFFSIWFA